MVPHPPARSCGRAGARTEREAKRRAHARPFALLDVGFVVVVVVVHMLCYVMRAWSARPALLQPSPLRWLLVSAGRGERGRRLRGCPSSLGVCMS